jgi:DNA-binding transcriptional LysR family regulator
VRRLGSWPGIACSQRGHRDVHPTDAGHTLLGYARRMLDLNEEMAQALAGATVETAVRIGVPRTSSTRRPHACWPLSAAATRR